jgi:predicted flap endonuclease-1-like 5' DNA nuclease
MKRVTKVAGFVGAALALIWAVRDRFISVAASREPQPPAFRIAPTDTHARVPVDAVEGIGPVFAGRLTDGGLDEIAKLASATPDLVAETAGVSVARAKTWIEGARELTR